MGKGNFPVIFVCAAALSAASAFLPAAEAAPRLMDHSALENIPLGDESAEALNKALPGADPAEAAKALRRYRTSRGSALSAQASRAKVTDFAIPLPGTTLTGKRGFEQSLFSSPSRSTALRSASANPSGGQMAIVQFDRPLSIEDKIAFFDTGAVFYRQLAPAAVAAFLSPQAAQKISALSFVRWAGPYLDEYKYSSSEKDGIAGRATIYAFGQLKDDYRRDLASLGIQIIREDSFLSAYDVSLSRSNFPSVAALSWVRSVAAKKSMKALAANFWPEDSRKMVAGPVINSGTFGTAFTGTDVTIGVYDTGVSITNAYELPATMFDTRSNLGDAKGHGTHVAGIIAARGGRLIDGTHNAKGMAPASRIYMIRGVGEETTYSDHTQAFTAFRSAGIQLSNHSWGSTITLTYDDLTEEIDTYSSDNSYPMLNIFSAGDSGAEGAGKINNPGIGKNVITVGAIQYVEDPASTVYRIGARAPYSSLGPTEASMRLKPELVAPGGMKSTSTITYSPYGVVSVNYNLIAGENTWPSDPYYLRMEGTSMAAPHVTGVAAYLLQFKKTFSGFTEWAKAWLINCALPIAENTGAPARAGYANTSVGYGLVEPINILYDVPGESEKITEHISILTQGSREVETWDLPIASGTKRVAITMAYNDYPGASLMNNLDLTLRKPDGTDWGGVSDTGDGFYWGGLATGVTGESPIEKIILDNPTSGNWQVRIYAKSWPTSPLVPSVRYAFVAKAYYAQPILTLSGRSHYYAKPSQSFSPSQTVTNSGGGIAAGVTLKPASSSSFGGELGQSNYIGNLSSSGTVSSSTFSITAPSSVGTYTLTLYANSINMGATQASRDITVDVVNDSTPPTGTIVLNGGATYSTATVLPLTLSATDTTGVESMRFSENGSTWTDWVDYSTSAYFTIGPTAGAHTVYVQYKDGVGNTSAETSISSSITLDMVAPQVSMLINDAAFHTSTTTVKVSIAQSAGGSPITLMRLGNDSPSNLGAYVTATSSCTWELSSGDGTKTVYMQVKAASGLESEITSDSIILISTPPAMSVSIDKDPAPQGQRTITVQSPAQLQGTPSVTVIQNGQSSSTTLTMLPVTTMTWTWRGFYTVIPGYEGTATITATAVDLATNTAVRTTDFTVDTTSPTARLTYLTAQPTKSGSISLSLEATDSTAITAVSLSYSVASSTTPYTITLTPVSSMTWGGVGYVDSSISSGTASFAMTMQDAAGNIGTVINGDQTFSINTQISGTSGGVYSISDGTFVNMPAGTYSGNLFVGIVVPPAGRSDLVSSKTINFYSEVISEVNLSREFGATDANSGGTVNAFQTPMTIAIPYPDADNNGVIDGTHIKVSAVKLFYYTTHGWQMLTNTVTDTVNKFFKADVYHFSLYSARAFSSAATFDDARAYPNPCRMKQYSLTIDHLPLDASEPTIKIYNLAGELVRTLTTADGIGTYNIASWDGRNSSGEKASTGTYIFVLTARNLATKTIKAAIIW